MDDLEKAILFSFDQTGAVDSGLRERAVAYCEQAKQSPLVWRFCLERFVSSQYSEVQFWCLQVLEEVLKRQYLSLDPAERAFVKTAVTACICGGSPTDSLSNGSIGSLPPQTQQATTSKPAFVKNKLAQIVVILILLEYPSGWPSVFLDMLGSLGRGPVVVDMFCRILGTLDEEVISMDYPRTQEENAAAVRIKDSMREQCISQIVDACYGLIISYEASDADLAALVLETAHRYVAWIDIGLVANEKFVPLLFRLLASPNEPVRLRGAACDFLLAIVLKRMEALAKLALLQRLQVVQVCSRLTEVEGTDFALKLTALLTGLAVELVECSKKIEGSSGTIESQSALTAINSMLDDVLPAIFFFMEHGDEEISATTFQFLLAYVSRIKRGSQLSDKQGEHLSQLLKVIRGKMRYQDDVMESLAEENTKSLDEEEHMAEYRRDLNTLFRNVAKIAPQVAWTFVQAALLAVLQNSSAPPADVEVAITLLYLLGEGITDDALKPGGLLGEMLAALLSSSIPCHAHRVVALTYMETVVRYVRFLQQQPQYLPAVLSAFLDNRGVHHSSSSLRSRACYLFMKLVKVMRSQLTGFVPSILQSLQATLAAVAVEQPVVKGETGAPDERLYIFEAVGLLVGLEDIPPDKQQEFLASLLAPLCQQINNTMSRVPAGDHVGPPSEVAGLLQVIPAIAYLSKGFGETLTSTTRPEIGALFKQTVELVMQVLQQLHKNKILRPKVVSFLHRMVECLGSSIFPALPAALQQLLVDCEAKDMIQFIQLINQLINKFKAAMTGLLIEVLSPVTRRVFAMVPTNGPPEGPGTNTEEIREQREVQRSFFVFLQTITANDLTNVFLTPQNSPCLTEVMSSLLQAGSGHADMTVRKLCFQIVVKFVKDWCGPAGGEKVPGFNRFVIERFAAECCVYSVLRNSFDLRDANTVSVFNEIVSVQKVIYEKCGDEFLVHLASVVLPAVHCPPNVAEQYCMHLQRSGVKELKAFIRPLVEQLRPLQNGNFQ